MKEYIYGLKPVLEALRAGRRKFFKIYISRAERSAELKEIVNLSQQRDIPVIDTERKRLTAIAGVHEHQGVVAQVTSYPVFSENLLKKNTGEIHRILLLDRIQDPRNFGAILRSACAFGFYHVVVPVRDSAPPSPLALKASAGLMERVIIYRVSSLTRILRTLQKKGFMIISAHSRGGKSPEDVHLKKPLAVVMGNEMSGVSRDVLKISSEIVTIPLARGVDSLNVSVACGIMLYEIDKKLRVAE